MRKRLLITGASGILGGNLIMLLPREWEIIGIIHEHPLRAPAKNVRIHAADLLTEDIVELLESFGPLDAVIHTAALTNVDTCEMNKRLCWQLNALLAKRMAEACKKQNTYLVHISTDHIFSGKNGNYTETDTPHPVNYYAETKLAAEEFVVASGCKVAIIRTNFFGFSIQKKRGIAGWMLEMLQKKEPMTLFTDVRFSPILVNLLVPCIAEVVKQRYEGIFHIAAKNSCSKEEFGRKIAHAFDLALDTISSATSDESPLFVPRPKDMSLNSRCAEKLLGILLPTVDTSIAEYKNLMENGYSESLLRLASS